MNIRLPGRVWDDYLDPSASGMQAELGLPVPTMKKAGKGWSVLYVGVPEHKALALASYLYDRGDTLLAQGIDDPYDPFEKAERDTHRAAMKAAQAIRLAALVND